MGPALGVLSWATPFGIGWPTFGGMPQNTLKIGVQEAELAFEITVFGPAVINH